MRNIEIKARITNIEAAEAVASRLSTDATPLRCHQRDTYFNVPSGRLKLRQCGDRSELIYYVRRDQPGPKRSDYEISPVDQPEKTRSILGEALGIKVEVRKQRTIYFVEEVRVHLDSIEGLGCFLELEAVLDEGTGEERARALVLELLDAFSISDEDLVEDSYCDLVKPG